NDNLLRDFQAGGDVKTIYACRDSQNLYLRAETRQPVSSRVQFNLQIKYFGSTTKSESVGFYTATIHGRSVRGPSGMRAEVRANRLEASIPLRDLGNSHRIAVNLETTFAGLQVDRTGYRFLDLPD